MIIGYIVSGNLRTDIGVTAKGFDQYPVERHPKPAQRPGGVDNSISKANPGKVFVAFLDNGCGIPAEHLQMAHQPLQTTKERGVDIGLCHKPPIVAVDAARSGSIAN
jgi:signal transduction histidine kinase